MSRDPDVGPTAHPATAAWLRRSTGAGMRVLEVGCGPAQYRRVVRGAYIGLDITARDYRPGLPRRPDVLGDAHQLPFRDAAFDLVFFSGAFHLFAEPHQALREARRIVRPGGQVAIFDYSRRTLERLADTYARTGQGAGAARLTCVDWLTLMRDAGWRAARVQLNSRSFRARISEVLLPRPLWNAYVDRRELALLVTGRAPV